MEKGEREAETGSDWPRLPVSQGAVTAAISPRPQPYHPKRHSLPTRVPSEAGRHCQHPCFSTPPHYPPPLHPLLPTPLSPRVPHPTLRSDLPCAPPPSGRRQAPQGVRIGGSSRGSSGRDTGIPQAAEQEAGGAQHREEHSTGRNLHDTNYTDMWLLANVGGFGTRGQQEVANHGKWVCGRRVPGAALGVLGFVACLSVLVTPTPCPPLYACVAVLDSGQTVSHTIPPASCTRALSFHPNRPQSSHDRSRHCVPKTWPAP